MERKERLSNTTETVDEYIPELTTEQADYLRPQQEKALAAVSDPEDPHYEPDEGKRLTAARRLMREWEHANHSTNPE